MKSFVTPLADRLFWHCINWQDHSRLARLYVDFIARPVLRAVERIEAP